MGLGDMIGSWFKSGEETTVNDPYKHMPDWQKERYKQSSQWEMDNLEQSQGIRDEMAANPETLSGLSDQETGALRNLQAGAATAGGITQGNMDLISGIGKQAGALGDALGAEGTQAAQQFADESAALTAGYAGIDQYTGLPTTGADMDAVYDRFENQYTDDVVDTTLSGMDRNAQREARDRNAQYAAAGGLSNSRAGVSDAVASSLFGMDRAEMEAGLRSDAFDTSRTMGLNETNSLYDWAGDRAGEDLNKYNAGVTDLGARSTLAFDDIDRRYGYGTDAMDRTMDEVTQSEGMNNTQFGRDQVMYNTDYNQGVQQRGIDDINNQYARTAKKDAASWFGGMVPQMARPDVQVATQKTASPAAKTVGTAANLASIAAPFMAASDERVKMGISIDESSGLEKLAKLPSYEYEYRPGFGHRTDRTTSLMAQDVENAGITGGVLEIDGVKHVDYPSVISTVIQGLRELDARTTPPSAGI